MHRSPPGRRAVVGAFEASPSGCYEQAGVAEEARNRAEAAGAFDECALVEEFAWWGGSNVGPGAGDVKAAWDNLRDDANATTVERWLRVARRFGDVVLELLAGERIRAS